MRRGSFKCGLCGKVFTINVNPLREFTEDCPKNRQIRTSGSVHHWNYSVIETLKALRKEGKKNGRQKRISERISQQTRK